MVDPETSAAGEAAEARHSDGLPMRLGSPRAPEQVKSS
jgi:hypothetical protein